MALGEHGGVLRRHLRVGPRTLPPGTPVPAGMAAGMPILNRRAMAESGVVEWFAEPRVDPADHERIVRERAALAEEIAALRSEVERLVRERDRANGRAGAATRKLAALQREPSDGEPPAADITEA